MTYRIDRSMTGHFLVFMDYDCKKVVELADTLDADPKLDFCQYTGNKKANMHTLHLRIIDDDLRRADLPTQKAYIDAICKPILSEL